MDKPKISVIMAAYNKSRHIKEAIDSILQQTMQDFELVVVDDASTDDTDAIVRSICDPRIVLLQNTENSGPAPTRNKAVAAARGEYLAIMDADDVALPDRIEKEADFLDHHPEYGLIGSAFYHIDDNGARLGLVKVLTEDRDLREGLKRQNWFGHSTVLIRKSVFDDMGGYDTTFRYSHDYELIIRVAEKYKVANLSEPLCLWRSSPGNISYAKANEQKLFSEKARMSAMQRLCSKAKGTAAPDRIEMREPPLVSVIVPTHNRPELLGRTLQSILNQTYPHYEILVVNDAGAPVEGIVSAMNTKNTIMYLRHKKNAGLAAARNTGIRAARGSHIGYLDDDDIFYPDHLETLVDCLVRNKQKAAYADSVMACQKLVNGVWETHDRRLVFSTDFDNDLIFIRNLFPVLCIVHEKTCLDYTGMFDETLPTHEDWDLWIRLSRHVSLCHVQKVTSEYIRRDGAGGQMTTAQQGSFCETRKRIFAKYRHLVAQRPDILRQQEAELQIWDPERRKKTEQVDKLKGLLADITAHVEKGDFNLALACYENNRNRFPKTMVEMEQIDLLMARVRAIKERSSTGVKSGPV